MVYFLLMLFSGFVVGGIISGNIGGAIIGIIGCIICIVVGIASAYKKQKTPEKIVDAMVQLAVEEVVNEITYSVMQFNNKIENLKKNSNAEAYFTVSEIVSMIVNLLDAKNVLSNLEYNAIYKIYDRFSQQKEKLLLTLDKYMDLCCEIVSHFDLVAPYYLYCGDYTSTPITSVIYDNQKTPYREHAKLLIMQGKLFGSEWQNLFKEFKEMFFDY